MPDNNGVVLSFRAPQPCLAESCGDSAWPGSLLGPSVAMERLWSQIRRVAPYFRTALLTGEPGSGAAAAVSALHELSPFRSELLIVLPAMDAELQLSNMAASVNGFAQRMVYLPEVERLSRAAQMGLLRVLRLRGPRAACVVAFAGHDLRPLVSAGTFSVELATALNALRIALPPLRDRKEDLPTLVQGVISRLAEELGVQKPLIGHEFLDAAAAHEWPGNLDELEAMLRHLLRETIGEPWAADEFAAAHEVHGAPPRERRAVRMISLDQVIQEHLRAVLLACSGNKLRAAEVLGISRSTLYRMLEAAGQPLSLAS